MGCLVMMTIRATLFLSDIIREMRESNPPPSAPEADALSK